MPNDRRSAALANLGLSQSFANSLQTKGLEVDLFTTFGETDPTSEIGGFGGSHSPHLTSSRPAPPLYVRTPCTPASKLDQNYCAAPGDLPSGFPSKLSMGKAPNLNLVSAVRSLRALPASNHILDLFDLPKPLTQGIPR